MDKLAVSGNGFPAATEYLTFAEQSSHDLIDAITTALGDNVIISGMEDTGGVLSAGWLIYNNEILPFVSGALGSTIVIVEEVTSSGYDINETGDFNTILPVWKKRHAKFGAIGDDNVVGSFAYSTLSRIDTVEALGKDKLSLKRSGAVTVFYSGLDAPIATGDFTSAEIVPQSFSSTIRVKVNFAELLGDYIPIINLNSSTGDRSWIVNTYIYDIENDEEPGGTWLDVFKNFDINIIQ